MEERKVNFVAENDVEYDFGRTIQRMGSIKKEKANDVERLVDMGHDETEVKEALQKHNNDFDKALEELTEKNMNSTLSKIKALKKDNPDLAGEEDDDLDRM